MEHKILVRSLTEYNEGKAFVSKNKVRGWLGLGNNKASDLLEGLEQIEDKYFIPDVCRRILERSVC